MLMTTPKIRRNPARRIDARGFSQWQYDGEPTETQRPMNTGGGASPMVGQWERDTRGAGAKLVFALADGLRRHSGKVAALTLTFLVGAAFASGPDSAAMNLQLRDRLRRSETKARAREGELELTRLELARLNQIIDHSRRYKISADLAESIYDIALSEGIDPKVAFALVNVESEFYHKAVSSKGAVGLTQVMPATARLLKPGITYSDLFDHETNLRLGFRFLRDMIAYYHGDLTLALTAYNRGPGVVDKIRKKGGDPSNGYARAVTGGER
jgi:soluble lytic murein transglycosylase-like protein